MPTRQNYETSVLDYFEQQVRLRGVPEANVAMLARKIYREFNGYLYAEFKRRTEITSDQISQFQRIYQGSPDTDSYTFLEQLARRSGYNGLNGLLVEILQEFSQGMGRYF